MLSSEKEARYVYISVYIHMFPLIILCQVTHCGVVVGGH